jgi:hypothetical protein
MYQSMPLNVRAFCLKSDRLRRFSGEQLLNRGDDRVIVTQQDEFSPAGVKSDGASNRGTESGKNLHSGQVTLDDPNALEIAPSDGGCILEQSQPNRFNRAGVRGGDRNPDPASAFVCEILDDGLAGLRCRPWCRTLRGQAGAPAWEDQGEDGDESEVARRAVSHR